MCDYEFNYVTFTCYLNAMKTLGMEKCYVGIAVSMATFLSYQRKL